jgi:hypothetical protein
MADVFDPDLARAAGVARVANPRIGLSLDGDSD